MIRKLFLMLFCVADAITLYMSVGYVLRGVCGAKLVGYNTAHFVGYYMLAAPFGAAFIVCFVFTIILAVRLRKNKR